MIMDHGENVDFTKKEVCFRHNKASGFSNDFRKKTTLRIKNPTLFGLFFELGTWFIQCRSENETN